MNYTMVAVERLQSKEIYCVQSVMAKGEKK